MKSFYSKTRRNDTTGCLEWQGNLKSGNYPYGFFYIIGQKKLTSAHRMAWVLAKGEIPAGMSVMHVCDNPKCVEIKHLRLGTHQENMADRDAKGRCAKGEKQHLSKFTEEQVRHIRARPESGEQISKIYGVSRSTVNRIRSRVTWKHV